ncbi:MAG TPA: AAC(3) family N-acetyltransferase [Firmicutes bacterium]|jgi:aminoglycoside 3-N-acetyltransferase|nr:AAC(3) family N-acetyltransferase [Bacillota bacterium]
MYSKEDLKRDLKGLGIQPQDTLLVHSSLKSLGPVRGGAEAVLDAFCEYLAPGLLVLPTHTWDQINGIYNVFDLAEEPSCVGVLTNLFRQRPGVLRSWHPTHSVAAYGPDAQEFIQGEEKFDTPCPREGCWGKLYDRGAKVLFLGVPLTCNTLIHGVEEWAGVPNRISAGYQLLKIRTPDGRLLDRPMRRHKAPIRNLSDNYDKLEEPLLTLGIAVRGKIGAAVSTLIEVAPMVDLTMEFLRRNPDLFLDREPIPIEWYQG